MITIDGHTFNDDTDTELEPLLFTPDGWVIDAGCRGWKFTEYCHGALVKNVYAIDIENFSPPPQLSYGPRKFIFKQAALSNFTGQIEGYFFGDGTANFIKGINGVPGNLPDRPCETKVIQTITLQDIYKEIGTDIDLLKLDIEGAEYQVLGEGFEPIPKQITVETHQHCHEKLHNERWPEIFERLCRDYRCYLNVEYPRYLFMDCLFIRKDLV